LKCPDNVRAGVGYIAIFTSEYLRKCATYIQQIDVDGYHINIYQDGILKEHFVGNSPNDVWKASKKLKKFYET